MDRRLQNLLQVSAGHRNGDTSGDRLGAPDAFARMTDAGLDLRQLRCAFRITRADYPDGRDAHCRTIT